MINTRRSNRFGWKKFALVGLLVTGLTIVGKIGDTKPISSAPERLQSADGATLDKISLAPDKIVYLQTIDLKKMQIDQLVGEVERQGTKGLYYPSTKDDSSPYFKRLTVAAARTAYQQQHPTGIFSIVNASFFEEYQSSTRLSFPIKVNGALITGGSSPYGPIPKPKHPYYKNIRLKALTWDNEKATISDYNPATGSPLNQPNVKNGLVSYGYQDHPVYALYNDAVNLYHVIGVLNTKTTNRLLIATTNRTTLKGAAEVLRKQGVTGDIMTTDGGISTYLWSSKNGDLILPQVAKGETVPSLPHYLAFRAKNNRL